LIFKTIINKYYINYQKKKIVYSQNYYCFTSISIKKKKKKSSNNYKQNSFCVKD